MTNVALSTVTVNYRVGPIRSPDKKENSYEELGRCHQAACKSPVVLEKRGDYRRDADGGRRAVEPWLGRLRSRTQCSQQANQRRHCNSQIPGCGRANRE